MRLELLIIFLLALFDFCGFCLLFFELFLDEFCYTEKMIDDEL
jgi:hypothetical protein